jgi:hypothetical protein
MDLLLEFFDVMKSDAKISPTHISLYMALLLHWNKNNFQNPISITSGKIMPLAKINSRQTYNRRMRELKQYGYIKYFPSHDPVLESLVYLIKPESNIDMQSNAMHRYDGKVKTKL